jgi:hypothetical protein
LSLCDHLRKTLACFIFSFVHGGHLRGDQHPRAGRKLRAHPGSRQPKLNPKPPTAITVPVEQDSGAARLEAAEQRLPETLDPESLRKFGFAVQLCTLRWQGYFLGETRGLSTPVLETLARQLGLLPMSIDDYPPNEKTRWEHLERWPLTICADPPVSDRALAPQKHQKKHMTADH